MINVGIGTTRIVCGFKSRWEHLRADGSTAWTQRGIALGIIRPGFLDQRVWILRIPYTRKVWVTP